MRRLSAGMLGLGGMLMIAAAGCDRAPAPPTTASKLQQTTPATLPSEVHPTTQELLSGPYKKINFPGMPLAIQVPQSWNVQTRGTLMFLEGPTPSDKVSIQFAPRPSIPSNQFDLFLQRQTRQEELGPASSSPGPRKIELTEVGRMKLLQRIATQPSSTFPKPGPRGIDEVDAQGKPVMITITPVRWVVTAFIPQDNVVSSYELNILDMTTEKYDADKPLLERVINSLRIEDNSAVPILPSDNPVPTIPPLPEIR